MNKSGKLYIELESKEPDVTIFCYFDKMFFDPVKHLLTKCHVQMAYRIFLACYVFPTNLPLSIFLFLFRWKMFY